MRKNEKTFLYNAISNIDEEIIQSSLNYKPKNKLLIISSLAACICAAIITFGIINNRSNNNQAVSPVVETTTTSEASKNFSIYAMPKNLSDNNSGTKYKETMLTPVKTHLDKDAGIEQIYATDKYKSDGTPYDERDKSYKGEIIEEELFNIKPHQIEFSIACNNIVDYYNVQADKNFISYFSTTTNEYIGWNENINQLNPDENGYITWQPNCVKFCNEVSSLIGRLPGDYVFANRKERFAESNAIKKVYNSIENFNDYFGDKLTFELHYKNGTTEIVTVNITLNKEGKYLLNYSVK